MNEAFAASANRRLATRTARHSPREHASARERPFAARTRLCVRTARHSPREPASAREQLDIRRANGGLREDRPFVGQRSRSARGKVDPGRQYRDLRPEIPIAAENIAIPARRSRYLPDFHLVRRHRALRRAPEGSGGQHPSPGRAWKGSRSAGSAALTPPMVMPGAASRTRRTASALPAACGAKTPGSAFPKSSVEAV